MLFSSRRRVKLDAEDPRQLNRSADPFDEFEDFGSGLDFGEVRTPDGRLKQFTRGLSKRLLSKNSVFKLMRGLVMGALPTEYTHLISAGEQTFSSLKREIERAKENNADSLLGLAQQTEKQLMRIRGRLPGRLYERLESRVKQQQDTFKALVERNQGPSSRTDDEREQDAITDALSDVMATHASVTERQNEERDLRLRTDEHLRSESDTIRFNASLETLQGVRDDTSRMVAFNDNFIARYQRKQLEISYRQYFALRDIRKLVGASLDFNASSMDALLHNTSLTEAQKAKHAVRSANTISAANALTSVNMTPSAGLGSDNNSVMGQIRRLMVRDSYQRYRGNLDNFVGEFWPTIQQNLQNNLREGLEGLSTLGGMVSGFNLKDLPPEVIGDEAATQATTFMGRYVMPRLGRLFSPQMEALSQRLNGRNFLAANFVRNAPAMLQDFAHNPADDDSTLVGWLRSGLRSQIPEYRLDNRLDDASYKQLNDAATFNNLTQRSIVEIIPGYLSRLLHVAQQQYTGDNNIERETFDAVKGQWVTTKTARSQLSRRIVTETQRANIRSVLDDVMDRYTQGDETALSEEAEYALRNRMMADAARNGYFDPEAYIKGNFGADTTSETRDELINFFKSRFDFDENGKLVREYENLRRFNEDAETFARIRDIIPNSQEEIARLHQMGHQELLRELNLIYNEHGQDFINYDQLWSLYRGDDINVPPTSGPPSTDPDVPSPPPTSGGLRRGFYSKLSSLGIVDEEDLPEDVRKTTQRADNRTVDETVKPSRPSADTHTQAPPSPPVTPTQENDAEDVAPSITTIRDRLERERERLKARFTAPPVSPSTVTDTASASEETASRSDAEIPSTNETPSTASTSSSLEDRPTAGKRNPLARVRSLFERAKGHEEATSDESVKRPTSRFKRWVSPDVTMTPGYQASSTTDEEPTVTQTRSPFWRKRRIEASPDETMDELQGTSPFSRFKRIFSSKVNEETQEETPTQAEATETPTQEVPSPPPDKATVYKKGRFALKWIDLYSKKGELLASGREGDEGRYFDAVTRKRVPNHLEIRHPIVDQDGRFVITQEHLDQGLYDVKGNQLNLKLFEMTDRTRGLYRAGKKFHDNLLKGGRQYATTRMVDQLRAGAKRGKEAVTLFKHFTATFGNDAYLPGEEKPRLRVKVLREGGYTDDKGEVLLSFDDVKDTSIFDMNNNVVVASDELEFLITATGKKHRLAKNRGILGGVGRKLRSGARKYSRWTRDYYKKLPGRIMRSGRQLLSFGRKAIMRPALRMASGRSPAEGHLRAWGKEKVKGAVDAIRTPYRRHKEEYYRSHPVERNVHSGFMQEFGFPQEHDTPQTDASEWYATPPLSMEEERHTPEPTRLNAKKRRMNLRQFKWMKDEEKDVNPESLTTPSEALLNRINDTLGKQTPEEPRTGSWQQQLADRQEARETAENNAATAKNFKGISEQFKDVFGPVGALFSGGKAVWSTLFSDKDDAGEDEGDTTIIAGGNPLRRGGSGGGRRPGWLKRTAEGIRGRAGGTRTGRVINGLGRGGQWAGRGLLAGAALIAGSPIALGIAGASAVAGSAYYLWRRHQQTAGKLFRHRFAQYGIDPTDRTQAIPVLTLEQLIEPVTHRGSGGEVHIDLRNIDESGLFKAFNLDSEDPDSVGPFMEWLQGRFLPIWKYHQVQLATLGLTYNLTTLDREINNEEAIEFLDLLPAMGTQAYNLTQSPFTLDQTVSMTMDDIDQYYQEARDHYAADKPKIGSNIGRYGNGLTRMPRTEEEEETTTSSPPPYVDDEEGALTVNGTPAARMRSDDEFRSNVAQQARKRDLSFLQKLRGYGYGLSHFDDGMLDNLLTLEDDVLKNIAIDNDGQARFSGNADQYLADHAERLGVSLSRWGGDKRKYRRWFNDRFLTVLLAYVAKVKALDSTVRLEGSGNQLTKARQVEVGRAILSAKKDGWIWDTTVWETDTYPFPSHDPDESERLAKHLLDEFGRSTRPPARAYVPMPRPTDDDMSPGQSWSQTRHQQRQDPHHPLLPDNSSMVDQWRQQAGIASPPLTEESGYDVGPPMAPPGPVSASGAVYGGRMEGTGGAFEDVAFPAANNSREAAMPTLRDVERMAGVNAELLATFAHIESTFNYLAKAQTSTATGWFQFLDSTWDAVVNKYGGQYGIPNKAQDPSREARKDPRANALMGAELLKENQSALRRRTGREPTDTELYLAHFMGAPSAGTILSGNNTDAIAAHAYPKEANSNRWVFYDKGRPRTLGEIIKYADDKVAPGRARGSSTVSLTSRHSTPDETVTPTPTPTTPPGETPTAPDPNRPDIRDPGASTYTPNTPASQGPVDVTLYDQDDETAFEPRERSTPSTSPSRAFNTVEQYVDPYGPRLQSPQTQAMQEAQTQARAIEEQREQHHRAEDVAHQEEQTRRRERRDDTQAMGDTAEQQLVTQRAMLTYLEKIADTLGIIEHHVEPEAIHTATSTRVNPPPGSPGHVSSNQSATVTPSVASSNNQQQRHPSGVSMSR